MCPAWTITLVVKTTLGDNPKWKTWGIHANIAGFRITLTFFQGEATPEMDLPSYR
jgi:hypothetical protein